MHTGWSTGGEYMANAAFSGYQRNSCGYCKSENGSMSHFLLCPYIYVNGRSIDSAKALLITVAPSRSVRSITMNLWIGVGEGRTLSSYLWIYDLFFFFWLMWKDRERFTTSRIYPDHAVRITPLDSKPQSSRPGETNAKPSIAGTNSSLGRSISVKRLVCVLRLASRSSSLYIYSCFWQRTKRECDYREKKYRKCNFDVQTAVHETEYAHVKRPIDPSTKRPLEPAHRFEVNLEGDSLSQAKYVSITNQWLSRHMYSHVTDSTSSSNTKPKSTETTPPN